MKHPFLAALVVVGLSCQSLQQGDPTAEVGVQRQSVMASFATGTLIVPMDTTYQNDGMLRAYGLVYALLKSGVPVHWAVKSGKASQAADFTASTRDVVSMAAVSGYQYRGGPFVIDAADAAAARPLINAWLISNPTVHVHEATTSFTADVMEVLRAAPRIGVFQDDNELIAFNVLNAAGITDATGQPWPTATAATYPGRADILTTAQLAGPSSGSGTDSVLLRADGTPAFHFLISMHYDSPNTEVVREVRQWLDASVLAHAYMQCSAVTAFENDTNGRFLTTQGVVQETDTNCVLLICNTTNRGAPNPVVNRKADELFNQYDGPLTIDTGALQSMGLASGSALRSGTAVMLAGATTGNTELAFVRGPLDGNASNGLVSYLVGHDYSTNVPITGSPLTNGARLLLNSLLASSMTKSVAQPNVTLTKSGPTLTSANLITWTLSFTNTGAGVADSVVLTDTLPMGAAYVSASNGGTAAGSVVTWQLGTLAAGEMGSVTVTVAVSADGTYANQGTLAFKVGLTSRSVTSNTVSTVRDATAPNTTLLTTPPARTNSTMGTFTFSSTETGTFECRIDGGAFGVCTTPHGVSGLGEGTHTFEVRAIDAAGNVDATPASFTWRVDLTAPAAPTISSPAMGDTTTATPTISGLAEPGSTVTISFGMTVVGTVTADATTGAWTYTLTAGQALASGSQTVTVTATDAANNTSQPTTRTFTVDATTPPSPTITAPANGSATNDNTPLVTGTATPNSTVHVYVDGVEVGTAVTSAGGTWQFQVGVALADGTVAISARQQSLTTMALSAPTVSTVRIDTAAPAAPVVTAPTANQRVNTTSPTVSGTSEPFATVTVTVSGSAPVVTTADATGAWTVVMSGVMEGSHTVSATAQDTAGNAGPASMSVTFVVDLTAPAAPVVTAPTNGQATNDATPTITGTAEAGARVQVFVDNVLVATVTADGMGNWSYTPPSDLSMGQHQITTRAVDAAGNQSPESMPITVTIDTSAPAVPVISSPTEGSKTSRATPPVTGTAEPGATVTVLIDGMTAGTAVADAFGSWTFTPPMALSDGLHTVAARATDAAGNASANSTAISFTVDTMAPGVPVISSPTAGATVTTTPTFTGTAEPGALVAVIIDGVTAATVQADGSGNWLYAPGTPIPDGMHTVSARATDAAGNQSMTSTAISFTTTSPSDGGVGDAGVSDGGPGDGGMSDGGTGDGGMGDGGMGDGGMGDGGMSDGGVSDGGMGDAGMSDAGVADGGTGGGGGATGGGGGSTGGGGGSTGGGGGSTGGGGGSTGGGSGADAGDVTLEYVGGGCGCTSVSGDLIGFAALGLLALARRRRR